MTPILWQRWTRLSRELGATAAALFCVDRMLRHFAPQGSLVYYRFVAQPLREQARLPPGRGRHFAFRWLQGVDPTLAALQRPPAVIAERFARGAQCLLATKAHALVGCIWCARGVYREDEVQVDYVLPEAGDCVWDFDVVVTPEERLGFLFAKLWDVFDARWRALGVRYSISRINAFNQRSLASHRSLGAQDCGWALFLVLGKRQFMLSDRAPYVALGGRPQLQLRPPGP